MRISIPSPLEHLYCDYDDVSHTSGDMVAEPEDLLRASDIPEKLVSCIWFEPRWRPELLETLDGRRLTVHSPGQWNRQAGPDFLQAVLEYSDGERCRGDVEVHRLSSGWTAHGHHVDARYNRVVLHVVLRHDRSDSNVVRADGKAVPQVALEPLLPQPLSAYRDEIPLADYPNKHVPRIGQCYTTLRALPHRDVQRFLERAGEARFQQRARRWSQRMALVGTAQAMYEAVFRALGSSGFSQRFIDMAHRLPWEYCQQRLRVGDKAERPIVADALLFGVSGLLDPAVSEHMSFTDVATQAYLSDLKRIWTNMPQEVRHLANPPIDWRHPHVRPMNTPERRLAGMAQLLGAYGETNLYRVAVTLCREAQTKKKEQRGRWLHRALTDMLVDMPIHAYWGARLRFGGRPGREQRLIGKQRALTIVVDAMLPLLRGGEQGDAELEALLLTCYRVVPRLPNNYLLRDMSRRLLGDDPDLVALVTHARHQQGMLQVYEDYCRHDEGGCQSCGFPQL